MHGRLEEQTMREILSSPSFDRGSMEREYMSRWSGARSGSVFGQNTITTLRKIIRAHYRYENCDDGSFYVIAADMAKDGSADTAVIVYRVTPGEYMFNFKTVNLFTISSTDYEVVANELKKTIALYEATLFVYDANGIGAALRDWMNKPTRDKDGVPLPGYGIINPPDSAKRDVFTYSRDQTICYEIKSGGKEGERIHRLFFSRISNGSIRFLIKTGEAILKFQQNKSFLKAPEHTKRAKLAPYRFMDLMEEELRNLIITDTSDNITNTMRVDRRDKKVQKDFFSAAEYGVAAVVSQIEQDYYKRRQRKKGRWADAVLID